MHQGAPEALQSLQDDPLLRMSIDCQFDYLKKLVIRLELKLLKN